jgi:MinD-like ATPase involved in chromosome partitioning or flagellar assembly
MKTNQIEEKLGVSFPPTRGKVGNIISLVSGKGGVGKTIITANLGLELAQKGARVLLVDMDFFTHGLSFYLTRGKERLGNSLEFVFHFVKGLRNKEGKKEVSKSEVRINLSDLAMKIDENLWLLPPVSEALKTIDTKDLESNFTKYLSQVFTQLRMSIDKDFDFIIIDQRSGTDSFIIRSTNLSDQFIIVTEEDKTSQRASIFLMQAIKKSHSNEILILRKAEYAGFIINMFTTPFPIDLLHFLEESVLGGTCLGMIPLSRTVRETFVKDKVMMKELPEHNFSKVIRRLASLFVTGTAKELTELLQHTMRMKKLRKISMSILPMVIMIPIVFMALGLPSIGGIVRVDIFFIILSVLIVAIAPWFYILFTKWEE